MSDNILDLRQNDEFAILLDVGTSGHIVWSDIPILDTNYTVTITDDSGSVLNSYASGSGVVIDTTNNSVTWSFDSGLTSGSLGCFYGKIESDSKEIGNYLRIFFKLEIE